MTSAHSPRPPEDLSHSEQERSLVEAQLGRPLRGRWKVARVCHLDVPMVIENHPRLQDGSPFPTTFWLTCPLLVKRASRQESGGRMAELTARLEADAAFGGRVAAAAARYRAHRDRLEPLGEVAEPGGGSQRIKCLHAHVAHELGDGPNPVGAMVLARTGWPDCVRPCVTSVPTT
ncbi:MAG: DUF501 domain-containing protein [Actinobacteria bacterium]|nr:DUF501 domain-containing protein [Actinomycetota bacterium]